MDISNLKSNIQNTSNINEVKNKSGQKSAVEENIAQTKQNNSAQSGSAVEIHLQNISKHQLNMTILHRTLAGSLNGFSDYASKPLAAFEVKQPDETEQKSLFDFEEVAKNVLNFVEGALNSAAKSGASQDELNEMLDQARKGVEMGVSAARKELGVDENSEDELAIGIKKADELINQGLDKLFERFNPEETQESVSGLSYDAQYRQDNNSTIFLQTKEGDIVNISFASIQAYQERLEQQSISTQNEDGQAQSLTQTELNQAYFQSEQFSFSVEGDLNEDELKSIGDLVSQVGKVSDSFYRGNVQAAYQQAQKLGFDEAQISHFAMNLSQQTQVSQSYTSVSSYQSNQTTQKAGLPESVKQPLNDYVKELTDMVEKQQQNLAEQEDLQSVINRVFSQQFNLKGNDLIDVVNRFNHFNQKILINEEDKGESLNRE